MKPNWMVAGRYEVTTGLDGEFFGESVDTHVVYDYTPPNAKHDELEEVSIVSAYCIICGTKVFITALCEGSQWHQHKVEEAVKEQHAFAIRQGTGDEEPTCKYCGEPTEGSGKIKVNGGRWAHRRCWLDEKKERQQDMERDN